MTFDTVTRNLEKKGYTVRAFANKEEAARYLAETIRDTSVGFGGSVTLRDMGIYPLLREQNRVYWHWEPSGDTPKAEILARAATADVYLTSANALSESGEIVNIDGTGNRLSSMLYGHKKVYFVIGKNKICESLPAAIDRARNTAAPLNARRLSCKTPCVTTGKCEDCASPDRICAALSVLWKAVGSCASEVLLIDEELGY